MSDLEIRMAEKGFIVSKKLLIEGKGLYVDEENKKWVITGSDLNKLKRFEFSQIVDYELFEDGCSIMSGRSGAAILGGLAAGAVGAIIGGSGKRKSLDYVNVMQIRIALNDLKHPSIIYNVPFGFSISRIQKGTGEYVRLSQKVFEFMSLLSYMKKSEE